MGYTMVELNNGKEAIVGTKEDCYDVIKENLGTDFFREMMSINKPYEEDVEDNLDNLKQITRGCYSISEQLNTLASDIEEKIEGNKQWNKKFKDDVYKQIEEVYDLACHLIDFYGKE